eukprot:9255701-Ditylum_brightwellii.AAC.1
MLNSDLEQMRNAGGFTIVVAEQQNTEQEAVNVIPGHVVGEVGTGIHQYYIPVELFFASDILLYSMVLGKDGYSTWWCVYCNLFKKKWEKCPHAAGDKWTIQSLTTHGNDVVQGHFSKNDAQGRKGVCTPPEITLIPVGRYILPILHFIIGK